MYKKSEFIKLIYLKNKYTYNIYILFIIKDILIFKIKIYLKLIFKNKKYKIILILFYLLKFFIYHREIKI